MLVSVLKHFRYKHQHILNFVLTSLFLSPLGFPWRILRRRRCLWTPMAKYILEHCLGSARRFGSWRRFGSRRRFGREIFVYLLCMVALSNRQRLFWWSEDFGRILILLLFVCITIIIIRCYDIYRHAVVDCRLKFCVVRIDVTVLKTVRVNLCNQPLIRQSFDCSR